MEGNMISLSMVRAPGPGSEDRVTSWVDGKQAKRQIEREVCQNAGTKQLCFGLSKTISHSTWFSLPVFEFDTFCGWTWASDFLWWNYKSEKCEHFDHLYHERHNNSFKSWEIKQISVIHIDWISFVPFHSSLLFVFEHTVTYVTSCILNFTEMPLISNL